VPSSRRKVHHVGSEGCRTIQQVSPHPTEAESGFSTEDRRIRATQSQVRDGGLAARAMNGPGPHRDGISVRQEGLREDRLREAIEASQGSAPRHLEADVVVPEHQDRHRCVAIARNRVGRLDSTRHLTR
jgi:hypothetical protein